MIYDNPFNFFIQASLFIRTNHACRDRALQASTGKKINRLSDEPWAASELHQLRSAIEKQATYEDSAKQGQAFLSTIESSLNSAISIIDRAKVLAVQAGNDT